ncbi:alpha/beta family hydrolase [Sphingomonas daechungensis]|uniref:alpha/beta hydrolase family protein n=1 Tax=Sphingomonas daechungensis TaxID=1176646 RepID=UPI00378481F7
MDAQTLSIPVGDETTSGLLLMPPDAKALFVFAHGAGTDMRHRAMAGNAEGLAERGVATLRYNFLYTEKGGKRPDPPRLAHAAVRPVVARAAEVADGLPLFAGGRSFGGRMTSQAQADHPLPGVRGLAFLGFPLHPAGKPGIERASHLAMIRIPMLFVSGTRDALAELDLLRPVVAGLGSLATLHLVDQADHSFKVAAKSGRTGAEAEAEVLDALSRWMSGQ